MEWKDIMMIMLSYLLGCFSTGYYYVRFFYKKDIREVGTNVTGAYNVSRLSGRKGFLITFIGDALKGALPVILCRLLGLNDITIFFCIFMTILGHILPIQLKFKGGKGLSTAFGAFLAFHPLIILFWLIGALVLYPFIRRYTITCLFALAMLPLILFIADYSLVVILVFIAYALLILYAGRSNLEEYVKERAYQGSRKKKD